MADRIVITTPKGSVVTYKTENGKISARIDWNPAFGSERTRRFREAQVMFDTEVMRLMEPYMQMVTGAMIMSMRLSSTPGTGEVIVNTPYARKVYYSRSPVGRPTGALRGPYYFHRMKADKRDHLQVFAATASGAKT